MRDTEKQRLRYKNTDKDRKQKEIGQTATEKSTHYPIIICSYLSQVDTSS